MSLDGTGGKLDARVNRAVRVPRKPKYGEGPPDSGSRNLAVRAGTEVDGGAPDMVAEGSFPGLVVGEDIDRIGSVEV